ncbi:MAG: LysM peptidoglycan-binding domain-containing protein [Anaeromyxobacteraceae bacterium]
MNHRMIAVVLAALPTVAFPQSNALDQARGAGAVQQAGTDRRAAAADAVLSETQSDAGQKVVDLNAAAGQLEGVQVGTAPGTASRDAGPQSYVIQRGDTLWDLSGKFLESPWYWPKLWSYNPQIENPHWIYPGNPLRLAPAGADAPARVEIVAADAPPPREIDDLTRGNIDRAEMIDDEDTVTVGGPYKIGGVRPRGPAVLRNSFVTENQLDASGKVVAAFEEKLMLTTGDRIYGKFQDPSAVKVGQKFSIYKTEGPIVHPVTHRRFGWKTVILGTARVTAVDPGKATTLVVTYVNDAIERGDLIGPYGDQALRPLFTRPNRSAVDGFVIGVQPSIVTGAAEFNVVYLDRGKADGVEVGNTFEVVRSGDPLYEAIDRPLNTPNLPREVIGQLVVFDAQERASSAYVKRSLFELLVGDHVEMRPTGGQAAVKPGG